MSDPSLPLVSICTPTKDRPACISLLLRCIQAQTYPVDRLEWVVIDDGLTSVETICAGFEHTRYVRVNSENGATPLGRKRNLCHEHATGDILVYMDDDDYYPPRRVAHAVETLMANPGRLIAGASALPIYFSDRREIWVFGPYGPNHATAGSFAFRRELLETLSYDDKARCSEERHFLKGYTIPMAPLDSRQTILAMSHPGNTFDKRQLLAHPALNRVKRTDWRIERLIQDSALCSDYLATLQEAGASCAHTNPLSKG